MAVLTSDFLENRRKSIRYKKFVLPVGIFLVVAGITAAGFYLYEKSESKNSPAVAGATEAVSGLLPREWLLKYFGTEDENDPRVGGLDGDLDEDILTNEQEFFFGTDPTNPDTDGDGQYDGAEVAVNSNPLGEGELYSTEYAKQTVENFLETNDLQEFKKENIEKQVLAILNPPNLADVEINLPDPKTLKIINDSSSGAVDRYLQQANDAVRDLGLPDDLILQGLDNPEAANNLVNPALTYQAVNNLRQFPVPKELLYFHQLHIAALFAAANIMEIQKTIGPNADPEQEKGKYQEQYYQVTVIQKIEMELQQEVNNLRQKYPDLIKKYESAS